MFLNCCSVLTTSHSDSSSKAGKRTRSSGSEQKERKRNWGQPPIYFYHPPTIISQSFCLSVDSSSSMWVGGWSFSSSSPRRLPAPISEGNKYGVGQNNDIHRSGSSSKGRRAAGAGAGGASERTSGIIMWLLAVEVEKNDYIFIICTLDYHYCGSLSVYFFAAVVLVLVACSTLSLGG